MASETCQACTDDLRVASALFAKFHAYPSFGFELAGPELGYLKAWNTGKARTIALEIWSHTVLRRRTQVILEEEWDDTEVNEFAIGS